MSKMGKKRSAAGKPSQGTPVAHVILLCDAVSRDPNSGKVTIYGVFNRLIFPQLSTEVNLTIYAKISSGGQKDATLRFQFTDESGSLVGPDPLELPADFSQTEMEATLIVTGIKLRAGVIFLEILSNGKSIGRSYPIFVEQEQPKHKVGK